MYKIAKALKYLDGVEAVLVCSETYYDKDLFEGLFSEVVIYIKDASFQRGKWRKIFYRKLSERYPIGFRKVLKTINRIKPDIIHAFCEPYNHIQFILKRVEIPVVMSDGADFSGISSELEKLPDWLREQEKFCFENVSGICHKGPKLEIDYYRNHSYQIQCPEITWMDYCDEELFASDKIEKLSSNDGEIHVVYTGLISQDPKVHYMNYLGLGNLLASQKIHLHIYAHPEQYKSLDLYKNLDKSEPYFHLHKSMKYKTLINEIAKYDYGLWYHEAVDENRFTRFKQEVSIGNKFYTYLEAGLPVIIGSNLKHGCDISQRYGVGIVVEKESFNDIKAILSRPESKDVRHNVLENRKNLSISENAEALKVFYTALLDKAI